MDLTLDFDNNFIELNIDKPHKIFAYYVDSNGLEQFKTAMRQESVIQGALMPDAHYGYTLPIGAVIKSIDKIYPAYVGYDIGCGMCAIELNIKKHDIEPSLNDIKDGIVKNIPLGNKVHNKPIKYKNQLELTNIGKMVADKFGPYQIGTLGGGNHFIEIGYDETDNIWIIIHSGSRGVGGKIAEYYMKLAADINNTKNSESHNGFDIFSSYGQQYLIDMKYSLQFALDNRKFMINRIVDVIEQSVDLPLNTLKFINRNHNHVQIVENNKIIHRKGATHAEKGMDGVIPGNMRDGSFIVVGKGNLDSMNSSSHGAGRVLSRKAAKEKLDREKLKKDMKNIITNHNGGKIDEAPEAYKNIFEVMEMQKDLVEVKNHIKPLINIKG